MPRGSRCVILAAVGWLISSAENLPPGNRPKQHQQSVARQRQIDTQQTASAVVGGGNGDTVGSSEKDRGCDHAPEDRKSDLCAQWKAADAARDAADYAWWSMLAGVVSIALLVWTLRETRWTARTELRAYVFPNTFYYAIRNPKLPSSGIILQIIWKNFGSTPTKNLHFRQELLLSDEIMLDFPGFSDAAVNFEYTLAPSDTVRTSGMFLTKEILNLSFEAKKHIYVAGVASYEDVFGKQQTVKHFWRFDALRDPKKVNDPLAIVDMTYVVVGTYNGVE